MGTVSNPIALEAEWTGRQYMTFNGSFNTSGGYTYVNIRIYRRHEEGEEWIYYSQEQKAYSDGFHLYSKTRVYNWLGAGQMHFVVWVSGGPLLESNIIDYWCGVPPITYHFRAYGQGGDGVIYYGGDDIVRFG